VCQLILEITQESHYYPFGLQQEGDWYTTVAPENKYLYNGKELSEDFGIDLYAYGFRYYDPAIGRFTGVDPIVDEFPWVSTYKSICQAAECPGRAQSGQDRQGRTREL